MVSQYSKFSMIVNPPASPKAERQLLSKLDEVSSVMEQFMKTLEDKKSEIEKVMSQSEQQIEAISSVDAGSVQNMQFRHQKGGLDDGEHS